LKKRQKDRREETSYPAREENNYIFQETKGLSSFPSQQIHQKHLQDGIKAKGFH